MMQKAMGSVDRLAARLAAEAEGREREGSFAVPLVLGPGLLLCVHRLGRWQQLGRRARRAGETQLCALTGAGVEFSA